MNEQQIFKQECIEEISSQGEDKSLLESTKKWLTSSFRKKYPYHFSCLGRPIIQYPQDMVAIQEIIWDVKPDLIIETGIAHGGSLILSASMLAQIDMMEAIESGETMDPNQSKRKVLGIDIDIREHNKIEIEKHYLSSRIKMIQGSSIAPEIIDQVKNIADNYKTILIFLDSNHTHEHVLAELEAYAELASINSFCVVFDTIVEDLPLNIFPDRPWGPGDNPKTAVWEYLKSHPNFEIDKSIQNKLLITVAPDGYLKRVC